MFWVFGRVNQHETNIKYSIRIGAEIWPHNGHKDRQATETGSEAAPCIIWISKNVGCIRRSFCEELRYNCSTRTRGVYIPWSCRRSWNQGLVFPWRIHAANLNGLATLMCTVCIHNSWKHMQIRSGKPLLYHPNFSGYGWRYRRV